MVFPPALLSPRLWLCKCLLLIFHTSTPSLLLIHQHHLFIIAYIYKIYGSSSTDVQLHHHKNQEPTENRTHQKYIFRTTIVSGRTSVSYISWTSIQIGTIFVKAVVALMKKKLFRTSHLQNPPVAPEEFTMIYTNSVVKVVAYYT